jgi:hypothetical protein
VEDRKEYCASEWLENTELRRRERVGKDGRAPSAMVEARFSILWRSIAAWLSAGTLSMVKVRLAAAWTVDQEASSVLRCTTRRARVRDGSGAQGMAVVMAVACVTFAFGDRVRSLLLEPWIRHRLEPPLCAMPPKLRHSALGCDVPSRRPYRPSFLLRE